MRHVLFAILLAPVTVLLPGVASAHTLWSNDVTVNTAVGALAVTQFDPVMATDPDAGVYIGWGDGRVANEFHAFIQHYDALGQPRWPQDGLQLQFGVDDQVGLRIAPDGAGGFFAIWADLDIDALVTITIYAQRFDASATRLWSSDVVLASNLFGVNELKIIEDGVGGAVAVWTADLDNIDQDLYAQRLRPDGSTAWPGGNGLPICLAAGDKPDFDAVADGAGGAYVVWSDPRGADADIYLEHADSTGTLRYGSDGLNICNAAGAQSGVDAVTDGQAGMIVAWNDDRGANTDIYAQRMDPAGPLWTANGADVIVFTGGQAAPDVVPDGDRGAFVVWSDSRDPIGAVHAQRLSAFGVKIWASDGVPISTGIGAQLPQAVSDGAGGFITVFEDFRDTSPSVFAQRVDPDGNARWAANGVPVSRAPDDQDSPEIIGDGRAGGIVVWEDARRGGFQSDIYAQRIEASGFIGTPEPVIESATDVPNDEGGQVKVSWHGSWPELPPDDAIDYYNVFRSVPPASAQRAQRMGVRLVDASEGCESLDCLLAVPNGAETTFWEFVGQQDAFDLTGYSFIVPTTGDSVGGSNPLTKFMVQARSSTGPQFWNSFPDSGYSVDDLAPAAPQPFTGTYASGTTTLNWGANSEPDLAAYHLHRGSHVGFVPGPGNLVTVTTETNFVHAAGEPFYYRLAAADVHGNLSPYSLVQPEGTVGVPGADHPAQLSLAPVAPNPAREAAEIRFTLPLDDSIRLAVYDTQGREVQRLASGTWSAGEHVLLWKGVDRSGGRVGAGLYHVRLTTGEREIVRSFALVR